MYSIPVQQVMVSRRLISGWCVCVCVCVSADSIVLEIGTMFFNDCFKLYFPFLMFVSGLRFHSLSPETSS